MLTIGACAAAAYMSPVPAASRMGLSKVVMGEGGKGFGGGEATRDPAPTVYDPNDPKGKQQAIHKAESFAEYLAKRGGAAPVAPAPAPAAAAPPAYVPPPAAPAPAPVAPVAAAPVSPEYDPWMDDSKTLVTFTVNGVPKKYRVVQ